MKSRALAVILSLAAVGLTGCAAGTPDPATTVTVTATPAPAPTVTVTPEAAVRTVDSALDAVDAYALCKAQTMIMHQTAEVGRTLVHAAFADSVVVSGPNGRWYVEVPTTDQSREPVSDTYTQCIVGGTIGDPEWTTYGESAESAPPSFEGGSD